jgi:hypothetical protein
VRGLLAVLLLLFIAGGGAGCGGASASQPLSAVDNYAAALRAGDYGRAYEYMSAKYRREHSRDDFVRMMKDSPDEVKQTASRLTASGRRVEVNARFVYDDLRDELPLVMESGNWRIASDPLEFYPQDTPAQTVRSFVRAIELKRYDVVLRFVPNKWRQEMTEAKVREQFEGEKHEEVGQMMRLLAASLDNPIDQEGDKARMPYGDRFEVKLVREDGVWKVEDPD